MKNNDGALRSRTDGKVVLGILFRGSMFRGTQ